VKVRSSGRGKVGIKTGDFKGSSLAAVISIYGVLTLTGKSSFLLGG